MAVLTAAITAASTAITVDSAAEFPADAQFIVSVRDEPMTVLAVAGATFTVLRGSAPKAHPAGASVQLSEAATVSGRMTELLDQYGGVVVDESGLKQGWLDLFLTGFYNSHFQQGGTADVSASIVGTASTDADYAASSTDALPYWIVAAEVGAGTLQRVADATAPAGWALRWNGAEDATIVQDSPVIPGFRYRLTRWQRWTVGLSTTQEVKYSWRDANHAIIGTELTLDSSTMGTATQSTYDVTDSGFTWSAPANARYIRWSIRYNVGSGSVHLGSTAVVSSARGNQWIHDNAGLSLHASTTGVVVLRTGVDGATLLEWKFAIRAGGLLDWADVSIERTAAGVLSLTGVLLSSGEAWTAPTLTNAWINFGGTLGTAAYRKDAMGFVHLKGVVKSGTIGSAIFELPVGYRPAGDTRFPVVSNNAFGVCAISSAGSVVPTVGSNVSFSLDGITFRGDA